MFRSLLWVVLGAVFAIAFAMPPSAPVRANTGLHGHAAPALGNRIFGSGEFRLVSFAALPQWKRLLGRIEKELKTMTRCWADVPRCPSPEMRQWRQIGVQAAGLDRREQLRIVNSYFNQSPYKADRELYGVREYWATPAEFMARSGDCEDYAIAKYFTLRHLGFHDDELRIVMLYDRIRGVGHAILAVLVEGDILILDNQNDIVLSHSRYKHYAPRYMMNQAALWAAPFPGFARAAGQG